MATCTTPRAPAPIASSTPRRSLVFRTQESTSHRSTLLSKHTTHTPSKRTVDTSATLSRRRAVIRAKRHTLTKKPPVIRPLVLLWKNMTAIRQKRTTRRFSYLPDGFAPVAPNQLSKDTRAQRRHGGYWGPD